MTQPTDRTNDSTGSAHAATGARAAGASGAGTGQTGASGAGTGQTGASGAGTGQTGASGAGTGGSQRHWTSRVPVISHLKQSVGLQRGMLIAGLVMCAIVLLTALLAPLLAPYGFNQLADEAGRFGAQQPPSSKHPWGTTVGGFDVLSRVIWGARTAVFVIVVAVLMSIFLGVILGLISGYIGGWLDRILVVVADAIYAFPTLLLAIVMTIVISGGQSDVIGGVLAAAVSITVVFIPQYFRVVRAETVRLKAEPFVEAAQVIGVSKTRIVARHIYRNATRNLPLIFTLNASEAILTLAALGFLGFGIEPTGGHRTGEPMKGTGVTLDGGGFSLTEDGAPVIDDCLLALTGSLQLRGVLHPIASGDAALSAERFEAAFSARARPSVLSLFGPDP